MFRSLRSLLFILQALALFSPLLKRKRLQKIPFLLKEGALFALANWDVIGKYLEKRNWSFNHLRTLFKSRRFK